MADGIQAAARDWVELYDDDDDGARELPQNVTEWVQPYMDGVPQPKGQEEKCALGRAHATTVWDHLQREVQTHLERKYNKKGEWRERPAWVLLKRMPTTAAHKASTQTNPKQTRVPAQSDPVRTQAAPGAHADEPRADPGARSVRPGKASRDLVGGFC
eukprot:1175595-Prorocentrum_minimum.AAC.7